MSEQTRCENEFCIYYGKHFIGYCRRAQKMMKLTPISGCKVKQKYDNYIDQKENNNVQTIS